MKTRMLWTVTMALVLILMLLPSCAPAQAPQPPRVETVIVKETQQVVVKETQQVIVKETQQVPVTVTPSPEFNWKKYSGTTIRLLGPVHDFTTRTVKDMLPGFERDTGIKVTMETYPEAQAWDKIGVELLAGNKDLDVVYYQPQRAGIQYLDAKVIAPVEPFLKNPLLTPPNFNFPGDFFNGSIGDSTIKGQLIAVPTDRDNPPLLFYNKEILNQFKIAVPKTLEELEAAAKKIKQDSNGQIYGVANRGRGGETTLIFSYVMAEFGARWQDAAGKPTINTPEWIAAAEWYGRTLRESGPPGVTNYSYPEVVNDIQQGKAAFTLEGALNPTFVNDPAKSRVVGKIGVTPIPYGPAYKGGSESYRHATPCTISNRFGLSINSASTKKEAAWLFIMYMTSQEAQLNYLVVGRPPARDSVLNSPVFKAASQADNWYWDGRIKAADICYESYGQAPRSIQNVTLARDIIGKVVQGAILGQDVKPLAAAAQKELEQLLEQQNVKK